MKRFDKIIFALLILLSGYESQSMADDSVAKNLGNKVGIVDTYKINCAAATTHLDFKLLDSTNSVANDSTPKPDPQLINAHLSKKTLTNVDALKIIPNDSQELTLTGGNGAYQLLIDTVGTNSKITTKQNYTVQYRCLNSTDKETTASTGGLKTGIESAVKTIANNKTAKFTFTCAKNKKLSNRDSEKLYVKITNKLKLDSTLGKNNLTLSAQLYKDEKATNVTDIVLDDNYSEKISLKADAGDYLVLVGTTATDETKNNAKSYAFQYSCLDDAANEKLSTLTPLENN
ncbi:MAG: hypothetical protein NTZ70_08500 [Methylococcales bacterium]|nr:hypothetical protein [Methylococcales bacterium]